MQRIAAIGLAFLAAAGCQSDQDSGIYATHAPPDAVQSGVRQWVITDDGQISAVDLATVQGGPAVGRRDPALEPEILFYGGPLPTSFAVADDDRMFFAFPRWTQPVDYTVVEVRDGKLMPFPDAETNRFDAVRLGDTDPRLHFVSVQSVVLDGADRLWVLDTGTLNMERPIAGGAKVVAYDIKTREAVKSIDIAPAMKPGSYLNDARLDLHKGDEGYGYITDSGAGGIIVFDIATGEAWRKLDDHPSTMAEKGLVITAEGEPLAQRPEGRPERPVEIHADGIALSRDGDTLYWTPLTGRAIYSVPTKLLTDRNVTRDEVARAVKKVAEKASANDGITLDSAGRIYTTDFEDNAIRRVDPDTGRADVLVQDERLLWPDGIIIHDDDLYVTSNQLNRQPTYHGGRNLLREPFVLFRYDLDTASGDGR